MNPLPVRLTPGGALAQLNAETTFVESIVPTSGMPVAVLLSNRSGEPDAAPEFSVKLVMKSSRKRRSQLLP